MLPFSKVAARFILTLLLVKFYYIMQPLNIWVNIRSIKSSLEALTVTAAPVVIAANQTV
jgi:hypothetical protein